MLRYLVQWSSSRSRLYSETDRPVHRTPYDHYNNLRHQNNNSYSPLLGDLAEYVLHPFLIAVLGSYPSPAAASIPSRLVAADLICITIMVRLVLLFTLYVVSPHMAYSRSSLPYITV